MAQIQTRRKWVYQGTFSTQFHCANMTGVPEVVFHEHVFAGAAGGASGDMIDILFLHDVFCGAFHDAFGRAAPAAFGLLLQSAFSVMSDRGGGGAGGEQVWVAKPPKLAHTVRYLTFVSLRRVEVKVKY
eukprot:gene3780-biopygen12223